MMEPRLTVFFDGACPLCQREIGFYRKRRGADQIAWVDVSDAQEPTVAPGLLTEDALARLHVRLPSGRLESGARAFAELWTALPGFRLVGSMFSVRFLTVLLELGYQTFLRVRPRLQRLTRRRSR